MIQVWLAPHGMTTYQHGTYLLGRNGLLASLAQLLNRLLVVAQVLLAANEENGDVTAEVKDLGIPLLAQ